VIVREISERKHTNLNVLITSLGDFTLDQISCGLPASGLIVLAGNDVASRQQNSDRVFECLNIAYPDQ